MEPEEMVVGNRYKIYHMASNQRRMRFSVMDYLGREQYETSPGGPNYIFNGRPLAGTQSMPLSWIKHIEQVEKNTPITLNRIAK